MKKTQRHLSLIESKIEKLDFVFLNKIQTRLSYRNPYFLVCLNEVVHEVSINTPTAVKNLSMNDLLAYLNEKAENLYLSSNISEQLAGQIVLG